MIYFLRHTKPKVNSGICYGHSDVELADTFLHSDLPKVVGLVEGLNIDTIYSSPLSRCRQLAERVAEVVGVDKIVFDDRLMELNFGDWELLDWSDIYQSEYGKVWFESYLDRKCPNGESFVDLIDRADEFLKMLSGSEDTVLIVTHSGFIRAAMVTKELVSLENAFSSEVEYGCLMEIRNSNEKI